MIVGLALSECGMFRNGLSARAAAWTGLATMMALALPLVARAGDTPAAHDARTDAAWLQAIQNAARQQNFSGTIVYQRGDEVHASRVVQSFDGVGRANAC